MEHDGIGAGARLLGVLVIAFAIHGCGGSSEGVPDAGLAPSVPDAGRAPSLPDAALGERDAGLPPHDCTPLELEPAPADVLWVVDTSGSWESRADRYAGAVDAMLESAGDWSSAEHALAVFPRFVPEAIEASCDPSDYESADLDWGATPEALGDELRLHPFEGGSPLGPALAGAISVAHARAGASRGRSTHLVLVTDASPDTDEICEQSAWDRVAAIAAAGFDAGRSGGVHVHVLSVIGRAISDDHFAVVDAIADAGGGRAAIVNGGRSDVARSARGVLQDLSDRATICTRALPPGESAPASITIRLPDGTTRAARRVGDASECSTVPDGFYVDDLEDPTTLTLCSGRAGIGGVCEQTFLEARVLGAPRFESGAECTR